MWDMVHKGWPVNINWIMLCMSRSVGSHECACLVVVVVVSWWCHAEVMLMSCQGHFQQAQGIAKGTFLCRNRTSLDISWTSAGHQLDISWTSAWYHWKRAQTVDQLSGTIAPNINFRTWKWLPEHLKTGSGWIVFSALTLTPKPYFAFHTPTSDQNVNPETDLPQNYTTFSCICLTQENQVHPSDRQVTDKWQPSEPPKGSPEHTFTPQVVPWGLYGARTWRGSTYRVASGWPQGGIIGKKGYTYIHIYIYIYSQSCKIQFNGNIFWKYCSLKPTRPLSQCHSNTAHPTILSQRESWRLAESHGKYPCSLGLQAWRLVAQCVIPASFGLRLLLVEQDNMQHAQVRATEVHSTQCIYKCSCASHIACTQ